MRKPWPTFCRGDFVVPVQQIKGPNGLEELYKRTRTREKKNLQLQLNGSNKKIKERVTGQQDRRRWGRAKVNERKVVIRLQRHPQQQQRQGWTSPSTFRLFDRLDLLRMSQDGAQIKRAGRFCSVSLPASRPRRAPAHTHYSDLPFMG